MRPAGPRHGTRSLPPAVRTVKAFGALLLAVGLSVTVPALTGAGTSTAGADTVIGTCDIVASPTATHFTSCPGADLAGANLTGLDLSYADLAGADLTGAVLAQCGPASTFPPISCQQAELKDADLAGADLTNASLSSIAQVQGTPTLKATVVGGADLTDANLSDANLSAASLYDATFTDADLVGATFTGATFVESYEVNVLYSGVVAADLAGADLAGDQLGSVDLEFADLAGANLRATDLAGADLSNQGGSFPPGITIPPTNLAAADLTDANLTGAQLGGATLAGATLTRTELTNATLTGADLTGDDLTSAVLAGATLTEANLTSTNLTGVDLTGFDLTDDNLSSAVVNGANLTDANLTQADLTGASFAGATLTGANFSNTLVVPGFQGAFVNAPGDQAVVTWGTPVALPGIHLGPCTPPSGSSFPVGFTTVTCTLTDDAGDQTSATFEVDVTVATSTTVLLPDGSTPLASGVWLDAVASSPLAIDSVQFELTGSTFTQRVIATATPTIYGWIAGFDTTTVPNGTYSLYSSVSAGSDGSVASSVSDPVTVTIDNQPLATTVLVPSAGATLTQGSVLDASAQGLSDVTSVQFQLVCGGAAPVPVGTAVQTVDGWIALADLTGVPAGPCQLQSTAADAGGETATSAPLAVTVGGGP